MSDIRLNDHIENAFASVLVFYDQFKRSKLLPTDLSKIAKKYASKGSQLTSDLEKKYGLPIPTRCEATNIIRICQLYSVPLSYVKLLPSKLHDSCSLSYNPIYDIRSPLFDAEMVLNTQQITAAAMTTDVFDNLSKCQHLLSNYEGRTPTTGASTGHSPDPQKETKPADRKTHVFDTIGIDSCSKYTYTDHMGNETLLSSPFDLAYCLMTKKVRVRVVMRKKAGIGGILIGFLKAFDKHFNLLLTDVDEEYSMAVGNCAKERRKALRAGASDQRRVLRRHLPQLLVRGDNVILLGSYKKGYPGLLKIKNILHGFNKEAILNPLLSARKSVSTGAEECCENAQNGTRMKDANFTFPEGNIANFIGNRNLADLRPSHYIPKSGESELKSERKDFNRDKEMMRNENERSEVRPTNYEKIIEGRHERRLRKPDKLDISKEDLKSIPTIDKQRYVSVNSVVENEGVLRCSDRSIRQDDTIGVRAAHSVQRRLDPRSDTRTSTKRDYSAYVHNYPEVNTDDRKDEEDARVQSEYSDQDVRLSLDKAIGTFKSHCSGPSSSNAYNDSRLDTEEDRSKSKRREGARDGTFVRYPGSSSSRSAEYAGGMSSGLSERMYNRSEHAQRTHRSTESMRRDDGLHHFEDTSNQPRKRRKESPRRGSDWGCRGSDVSRRDQR